MSNVEENIKMEVRAARTWQAMMRPALGDIEPPSEEEIIASSPLMYLCVLNALQAQRAAHLRAISSLLKKAGAGQLCGAIYEETARLDAQKPA